jgi:transcriptional regulator with XRE-family HTH domain
MTEHGRRTGLVSARVAANVKRIRKSRGMSTYELARRLTGQRQVDADDVVALAVALNCSPVALLLPAEPEDGPVAVAGSVRAE